MVAALLTTTLAAPGLSPASAEPDAAAATAIPAMPSSWALEGVVVFARHGLRAPQTQIPCASPEDIGCMNAQSQRPWPSFGVATGDLLPHGYDAARVLGAYFRQHYATVGLLPATGCPDRQVPPAFFADDERTAMTGGGLADGMLTDCAVNFLVDDKLYMPKGGACIPADPKTQREAAAAFVGGSWADVVAGEMQGPIAAMAAVVGRYSPAACQKLGLREGCTLADDRATRTHSGPIGLASTPAELFLMEYGANFERQDVAWGRLEAATGQSLSRAIEYVNQLHALYFAATNMPPAIAVPAGSKSLANILRSLDQFIENPDSKDPPLVVYVGHDNFMLNVAGMLGLSWKLDGYASQQVPPGGAMIFEMWRTGGGQPMVRLLYVAQTPRQLRSLSALGDEDPPATALLEIAGCKTRQGACPWARFAEIASATLDPNCTR
jgi:4-phytase/acid phosphatase